MAPAGIRPDAHPSLPGAAQERPGRPAAPPVAEDACLAGRGRARRGDARDFGAARSRGAPRGRHDRDSRHGHGAPHGRRVSRGGSFGPPRHERKRAHGRPGDEPGEPARGHGRISRGGGAPRKEMARLGAFTEMRLSALLPKVRLGPGALSAWDVVRMATAEGASALRLPTGTLETGRRADLLLCLLYTSPSPRDRTRSRM